MTAETPEEARARRSTAFLQHREEVFREHGLTLKDQDHIVWQYAAEYEAPIAEARGTARERERIIAAVKRRMDEVAQDVGLEEGWEELSWIHDLLLRNGHRETTDD